MLLTINGFSARSLAEVQQKWGNVVALGFCQPKRVLKKAKIEI